MAKNLSTKKPLTGNRRSHALNATKHAQKPNFQKVTINGEKVILSAREAKTIKKDAKYTKSGFFLQKKKTLLNSNETFFHFFQSTS